MPVLRHARGAPGGQGGRFAPAAAPETPRRADELSLTEAAAEIDDLTARAAATLGVWERDMDRYADGSVSDSYESHGCSAPTGPFRVDGPLTLQVKDVKGQYLAQALMLNRSGDRIVTVKRSDSEEMLWPDRLMAMAALETTLAAGPEAELLSVTRWGGPDSTVEHWDWKTRSWVST